MCLSYLANTRLRYPLAARFKKLLLRFSLPPESAAAVTDLLVAIVVCLCHHHAFLLRSAAVLYQTLIVLLSLIATAAEVIISFLTAVNSKLTNLIARAEVARDFLMVFRITALRGKNLSMQCFPTAVVNT